MLYLFHGENTDAARKKMKETVASLHAKRPDAEVFKMDADSWDISAFEEYAGAQGLFSKKFIIVLDRVFENKGAKEAVAAKMDEVADSENVFLMLEVRVDKPTLTKITKKAAKVQEFAVAGGKGRSFALSHEDSFPLSQFNVFRAADAFGRRDKKELWVVVVDALRRGIPSEELHGIIFWQLKSMMIAADSSSAAEAGLKPFVYSKSKNMARNFSPQEMRSISSRLVSMYHDAHAGEGDFATALERFALEI